MSEFKHVSWQAPLISLFFCNRDYPGLDSDVVTKVAIRYGIPTERSSDSAINVTSGTTLLV
jgi:hypothetical protein